MEFEALNNMMQHAAELEKERVSQKSNGALMQTKVVLGTHTTKSSETSINKPSDQNAIWQESEVDTPHDMLLKTNDGRPAPEYDILYKQSVGSEDVYLGTGDKDPSSTSCDEIVIKVMLPNQKFKDLDLVVKRQSIIVSSPDYRLATYLPYPVDSDNGSAKWISDKDTLCVTLPLDKS